MLSSEASRQAPAPEHYVSMQIAVSTGHTDVSNGAEKGNTVRLGSAHTSITLYIFWWLLVLWAFRIDFSESIRCLRDDSCTCADIPIILFYAARLKHQGVPFRPGLRCVPLRRCLSSSMRYCLTQNHANQPHMT